MRLSQIAKDYGLKVTYLTNKNFKKMAEKYDDLNKSDAKNNAYLFIDDDHIVLGFYDDPIHKKAAFFHELGHSLVSESFEQLVNRDELFIEYEAWIQGLKVAKKYGVKFPDKVFKYILKSTNSYYKDSLRAHSKTRKNVKKVKA
jgi:hypothetical protein